MKRFLAALAVAILSASVPVAGHADAACNVLTDPAGDVAGPLGTPRPTREAGATVDLTGVSMKGTPAAIGVMLSIADLSAKPTAGTGGAIYTTFWTVRGTRFFAQAIRVATDWSFSAGRAAGVDDTIPQQGTPIWGKVGKNLIRLSVPSVSAGSPQRGSVLQQVRTRTQETVWEPTAVSSEQPRTQPIAEMTDAAGGPEGGRFLLAGACLPGISAAAERCLIAVDLPGDATAGGIPDAFDGTDLERETRTAPAGAVDPATEILTLQMGSNISTVVVDIAVARLQGPVPSGADAQRWDVSWSDGSNPIAAFAERRATGMTYGYLVGDIETPTSGSIDRVSGLVRILVPRHEIGADDVSRFTGIVARASIVAGTVASTRDTAPNIPSWSTQYVAGISCADQARAACPLVLDTGGDAGPVVDQDGNSIPAAQPSSDLLAAGAAGPDGSLVLSVRVLDIGAPLPDGYDMQGWTVSWTYGGIRFIAQAEATSTSVGFRTKALGRAADYATPTGPAFVGTDEASGSIDSQTGIVTIVVGRDQAGGPGNGALLTDVGAQSWVMSTGKVTDGVYTPARHLRVDDTPIAPYRTGLACGA